MNWRLWTWKDYAGLLAAAVIVGGFLFAYATHDVRAFSEKDGWICHSVLFLGSDKVCIKKPSSN